MTGAKFDQGKPPLALLPPKAIAAVGRVLGKGADKYAPHNWRKGLEHSRTLSAALRHIFAYLDGEDLDDKPDAKGNPGTFEHHLACAVTELVFALEFDLSGRTELDDRYRVERRDTTPAPAPIEVVGEDINFDDLVKGDVVEEAWDDGAFTMRLEDRRGNTWYGEVLTGHGAYAEHVGVTSHVEFGDADLTRLSRALGIV